MVLVLPDIASLARPRACTVVFDVIRRFIRDLESFWAHRSLEDVVPETAKGHVIRPVRALVQIGINSIVEAPVVGTETRAAVVCPSPSFHSLACRDADGALLRPKCAHGVVAVVSVSDEMNVRCPGVVRTGVVDATPIWQYYACVDPWPFSSVSNTRLVSQTDGTMRSVPPKGLYVRNRPWIVGAW